MFYQACYWLFIQASTLVPNIVEYNRTEFMLCSYGIIRGIVDTETEKHYNNYVCKIFSPSNELCFFIELVY